MQQDASTSDRQTGDVAKGLVERMKLAPHPL
jgi:hypothetical protein